MSEWLGKPRIEVEDIEEWQPMLPKYFPALTKYFVDTQKMRIMLVLEHELADRFKEAVTKTFGDINSLNVRRAALEALEKWVDETIKK